MITYKYTVEGSTASNNSWTVRGSTGGYKEGEFADAMQQTMAAAFMKLTKGEAVFGHPGLGCDGPYTITKLIIERAPTPTTCSPGKVPTTKDAPG